ncbi:hypothetical protein FS749_016423 [Ceratobasidium sp. UAMH 11750]|nr:hypothetical protein FS749_016423 [Ceratobasidium sp. UAMH 11750]
MNERVARARTLEPVPTPPSQSTLLQPLSALDISQLDVSTWDSSTHSFSTHNFSAHDPSTHSFSANEESPLGFGVNNYSPLTSEPQFYNTNTAGYPSTETSMGNPTWLASNPHGASVQNPNMFGYSAHDSGACSFNPNDGSLIGFGIDNQGPHNLEPRSYDINTAGNSSTEPNMGNLTWAAGDDATLSTNPDIDDAGEYMRDLIDFPDLFDNVDPAFRKTLVWPSAAQDVSTEAESTDVQWPTAWRESENPLAEDDFMGFDKLMGLDNQEALQYQPGFIGGSLPLQGDIPLHIDDHVSVVADTIISNLPDIPRPEPEPLYNPYRDGAEPAYVRIATAEGTEYRYASAGGIVQKAGWGKTPWQKAREENEEKYGGCKWGRWGTKQEWEDAHWMATSKASQGCLQKLLETERYANNPPKFRTIKNLLSIIEKEMAVFGGPKFNIEEIRLAEAPNDRHTLVYRCLEKTGDHLLGTARFAGKMAFALVIKFGKDGIRRYDNFESADYWNLRQRILEPGTTLGAVILMSDATNLSLFSGDVSAHAVYMSLANIDKSIREDISSGAWLLVAILPKGKWDKTLASMGKMTDERRATLTNLLDRRLIHRGLEIVTRPLRRTAPHEALDPEGLTRYVLYDMSIYGADLLEQCNLAGLGPNNCPQCQAKGQKLGECQCQPPRSSESILGSIKKVLMDFHRAYGRYPDPLEFLNAGKKYDLNGVQRPFWRKLPGFDIARVLSPDLLHGVHKLFFDHFHRWNVNALGAEEFDTRLKAQPTTPGERSFPQGVSRLTQLSGKDHRALERVHLAIVANAPEQHEGGNGSSKLTKATRAIMDCIFLSQLPVHSDKTLAAFDEAYRVYQANKSIWVQNKSKKSKKGKLIVRWAIPKEHIIRHVPEHIRLKGTCDNYNTETMEHLHVPTLKEPYRASNHKEWIRQVVRYVFRREVMKNYDEWMMWLQGMMDTEMADGSAQVDEDEDEGAADEGQDEVDEEQIGMTSAFEPPRVGSSVEVGAEDEDEDQDQDEEGEEEEQQDLDQHLSPDKLPESPESRVVGRQHLQAQTRHAPSINTAHGGDSELGFPTALTPLYRAAKYPNVKALCIGAVARDMGFPKLLQHLQAHPYFASIPIQIHGGTQISLWNILRVHVPASLYSPTETIERIHCHSGLDKKTPEKRSDAIFYLPTTSPIRIRVPEEEILHNYAVGRLLLLFALKPSHEVPHPLLMAYVQRFSAIPQTPSGNNGFYAVAKMQRRGSPCYEAIAASQIARPCPLAPRFKGPAARGVVGHESLEHYQEFYINRYRTPRNFFFLLSSMD